MRKKYGNLLSKTVLLCLAYIGFNIVYILIYPHIAKYFRVSGMAGIMYITPLLLQFVKNAFIGLFAVPIIVFIVEKMSGNKQKLGESIRKFYLPYVIWNYLTGIAVLLPTNYGISHQLNGHILTVWNIIVQLLLMKFALWLPMGINEGLSFKDSLVSSWKRLNIGWALAICSASFAVSFIAPAISGFIAKSGIGGFAHLIINGIVSAVFAYLVLVFNITVYWHILRKEGKIQA